MPHERTAVVVLCDPERAGDLAPFCSDLRQSGRFDVEVTTDAERVQRLDGVQVLYAHRNHGTLSEAQARAVARFVHNGGMAVLVGATLQAWSPHAAISDLAGWSPNGRTIRTELEIEESEGGTGFRVVDMFNLLPSAPTDAAPLLQASWHFSDQVLAYRRPVGAGSFTYVGLGHDPSIYANVGARRALARTVRPSDHQTATRSLGVGILGYGALGPAHAAALGVTPGIRLAAVADREAHRRVAARGLGVPVVSSAIDLHRIDGVDIVLVATPPSSHASAVVQALEAGKHVVCEKPFALDADDCDRMIAQATTSGRVLTVFQNRRWDPDYLMLKRVVRSGAIGEPFHMESFVGGYEHPCSLWHSHQPISGGLVYDWGSHFVDWILQLFDRPVVAVRGQDAKRMWHDVTNADHIAVDIRFDGGAIASFVQSDIAAAVKPKWYVLGTKGAVLGEWQHSTRRRRGPDGEMDEEPVRATDLPAKLSVLRPDGEGATNTETLTLTRRDRSAFYRNLVSHLVHGEPLAVPPQQARRVVAVLEAATASAAHGGALIEQRI
ncbi:MAG: Gfo/Idh/MocA family oxidoreductase [Candidatus Dormibacteraeota bacterium]|nr:Gfo/Idh/MocA family oxidoreductase [Candidatus Dormibacteraeota bacterium]